MICLYAELLEDGGMTLEAVRANDELIEALRVTWDGRAAHARATGSKTGPGPHGRLSARHAGKAGCR